MYQNVIPGRIEDANPESRDSGSGPADHPGMTECRDPDFYTAIDSIFKQRHFGHGFAISPRMHASFTLNVPLSEDQRAQGMPGARCARSLVCKVESTRVVTTVTPGSPGIPYAMVLTVSFVLSPVTGLVCHRHRRNCLRQLDASVGASGPPAFAIRVSTVRQRAARVHRIPPPTSVTIAKRPSEEAGPNRNSPVSTCPSNEIRKIRSRNPWEG